ncbi:MAG: hypothetical protein AAB523_02280 [Patescibacteria group bacterium]
MDNSTLLSMEVREGEIVAFLTPGILLCKGGQVVSRGTCLVPKGVRGRVVAINEPYADGHTTDVVICVFNGHDSTVRMKPGELSEDPSPKNIQ